MSNARQSKSAQRRALLEEQRRRQQVQQRRRRILGAAAVVLALAIIGVGIGVTVGHHHHDDTAAAAAGPQIVPSTPAGTVTVQPKPAQVANPSGIPGVVAYDTKGYPAPGTADAGTIGHDHVTGPVRYAVTPPVGGPHNAIWMNAGVYTAPVPNERAVHNLEHGAVWITYRPGLPAAQVAQLVSFVGKQSMIDEGNGQANRYVDLSPWSSDALPSPIVISSWGYQLKVTSPTDPRLQRFVDTFRHNATYTPEFGAPVDGIPTQTGGEPAEDGSKLPNPAGTAD